MDVGRAVAGFEDRVRESFGRQQFMRMLGARLELIQPGEVVVVVPAASRLTQQHGYVHAGVVTSIADTACGYAAYSIMPPDHEVLSVEFKVNLLAPAAGELMEARARVIRFGRTLSVCHADVYAVRADSRAHVATMLATIIGRPAGDTKFRHCNEPR